MIDDAKAKMVSRRPEETRVLIEEVAALGAETSAEHGAWRAAELGLRISNRKSLEEGFAYQQSLERLSNVTTFANRLARIRMNERDGRQTDMTVHMWVTYLYAHIDVTRRFIGAALGQLVGEDDATRQFRNELGTWSADRKKAAGAFRHTVAHADPTFVRAIDEAHFWEPAILFGYASASDLLDIIRAETEASNSSFNRRARDLRNASVLLVAQSDKRCETAASLISSKRA